VVAGVRQDEQPLSLVARSDRCCFKQDRSRHDVPKPSQISGNFGQAPADVSWHVLKKNESRPALVNDSCDLRPEVPRVGCPELLAGDGERLTRVSRRDEIHRSTPRASVEGSQVIPERRRIQAFRFHEADKRGGGKCLPLDVTDAAVTLSECNSQPEFESAGAGAQGDAVDGR
jgi:hypothetical protein